MRRLILLAAAGITVFEGFDPAQLEPKPDLVVVGNAGWTAFGAGLLVGRYRKLAAV